MPNYSKQFNYPESEIIPDQGYREVVVDRKTGQPRQAGADLPEGKFISQFKSLCETDLYVFGVGVMGRAYLTPELHLPTCKYLQKVPPFRKMLLMPRDHAKTSLVSHCLPPHIIVQPKETNIYFKDLLGTECRILLSGESQGRASTNLSVVEVAFEANQLLRAFWPHACWENPRRAAKTSANVVWNKYGMTVPRETTFPDPTVYAIGVGGAITGSRPNVIIKDDLISLEAANSDVVMRSAIEWHKASRALMDEFEKETGAESLEFIIGTKWAVFDLYAFVLDGDEETPPDYSVEVVIRKILEPNENGDPKPIWPERFPPERIEQLRKEFGSMFFLLYMNEASDPNLVDFDMTQVRRFELIGEYIKFEADERDKGLEEEVKDKPKVQIAAPGEKFEMNAENFNRLFGEGRAEYLRLKYQ